MGIRRILILALLCISLNGYSQSLYDLTVRHNLKVNNYVEIDGTVNLNDSTITGWYSGILVNDSFVTNAIKDSIDQYTFVTLGTANQIPFVNALGTDLDYSSNFEWNDTSLLLHDGNGNIFISNNSEDNFYSITTGNNNIGLGGALTSTTSGTNNIAIGSGASYLNETGSTNVAIGNNALRNNVNGVGNIAIGDEAGQNETGSNKLYIDNSSTPNALIKGDFATDELWLNTDTTHIAGHLAVDSNLYVFGRSILEKYEVAAYLDPDSTITTSVTTSFSFLGGGSNNKFSNIYAEGFSFDGDTLQFDQAAYDYRDSVEFNIDYSCATATGSVNRTITYGIMIKSVGETTYTEYRPTSRKVRTQTAGIYYSGAACSTMPIFLKDGDKIWIVAKCATNTATVSTQDFGIYLREQQ